MHLPRRSRLNGRIAHRSARAGIGVALLALLVSFPLAASADPLCVRAGNTTRRALMFSEDGRYAFCGCTGNTVTGSGIVTQSDNVITLEHDGPDYLRATIDTDTNSGAARLTTPVRVGACEVEDSGVSNGECACDFSCILSCPDDVHAVAARGKQATRVSYREPARSSAAACGDVTCSVASGNLFPRGTSTVRCAAGKAVCSFGVTVD